MRPAEEIFLLSVVARTREILMSIPTFSSRERRTRNSKFPLASTGERCLHSPSSNRCSVDGDKLAANEGWVFIAMTFR